MNLIIDIGNTNIKFALFRGQTLLVNGSGNSADFDLFLKGKKIVNTIISSVSRSEEVEALLIDKGLNFIHLSSETTVPVSNNYTTPTTLGDDRLANVIGASVLFPNTNVLTIDCGTCIKFDAITVQKEYKGGAISPGLQMRFKALNHFTNGLPFIEPQKIEGVITQYNAIYENLTVILTGGDASFFDKELKSNIFVESKLTLIGLNEILLYNSRS